MNRKKESEKETDRHTHRDIERNTEIMRTIATKTSWGKKGRERGMGVRGLTQWNSRDGVSLRRKREGNNRLISSHQNLEKNTRYFVANMTRTIHQF